jgi:hypothetical protein
MMAKFPWKWLEECPPEKPGWYATLYCFDPEEGTFPSESEWSGTAWSDSLPYTHRSPEPFATRHEAGRWASDNDPNW